MRYLTMLVLGFSLLAAQMPVDTARMVYICTSQQGYLEYLWLKDSSVMVRIPAGTFTMGSNDGDTTEKPMRQVHVSEYYIDKFEVTNQQYLKFCTATRRKHPPDPKFAGMDRYFLNYPDYPVVNVSWKDAKAYCDWAGKSLPTEAQWEKAARGTDGRRYPWGDSAPDGTRCNFADRNAGNQFSDTSANDGQAFTAPIGWYPDGASPYGCLDMAGNVWEWCQDWYDWYHATGDSGVVRDPKGPLSGEYRVARGGCWRREAKVQRCAIRHPGGLDDKVVTLGFRCAFSGQ